MRCSNPHFSCHTSLAPWKMCQLFHLNFESHEKSCRGHSLSGSIFPRNLQQDLLNGPLDLSYNNSSNLLRGPLARSHSLFDGILFPPSRRFFRRTFPPRFTVHSSVSKNPPPPMGLDDWTRGDVSSKDKLCDQPLVPDLYEYLRVEVRESTIKSDACYQLGILEVVWKYAG